MKIDDRIVLKVYGQHVDGRECVICLANDYEGGELEHKDGCDDVFFYVQGVRRGVGLQLPMTERVVTVPGGCDGQGGSAIGYDGRGQGGS